MTRNVSDKRQKTDTSGKLARRKAPAKAPRRSGRGALTVVIGTFVLAGVLRLGVGVGEAVERRSAEPPAQAGAHDTGSPAGAGTGQARSTDGHGPATPADCDGTSGLAMPLVTALKAREARVSKAETDLDDRRQALALTEKVVTAKLAELKAAEEKLAATLAIADGAAAKDVARLTEVYAAMKPKQASAVFEQMAPDFAAGFLGKMPPASAAAILSGLTPEKAYTVSVILAGRNAAAPRH